MSQQPHGATRGCGCSHPGSSSAVEAAAENTSVASSAAGAAGVAARPARFAPAHTNPSGEGTLNGSLLPDDVIPNRTDPANTASNGPARLTEQTLGEYRSERTIIRVRAEEPRPYDLVILSSFGGPEGQEDVIPFLRNVTAGRGIPDERLEEVATHYRANGGVSPINEQNRALLAALQQALAERGPRIPITWANRNWKPYVKDVLAEAYENGHRNVLVLATSAYPGYSSCRQYREDYGIALQQLGLEGRMHVGKIRQFFDVPGFARAFADGLKDGLVNAWERCDFKPRMVEKDIGKEKVALLEAVFGGARTSKGESLYASWPWDAGINSGNWRGWKLGDSQTATPNARNIVLGAMSLPHYFMTPYQAEFDTFKVNFDTILPLTLQTGALNDAVATDLTTFKARGGKMIIFEGVSDPVFSANDLRDWYRQLQHDTPGTQDFARLFMVPGMTHCGEGNALDDFDPLTALENWAEKGEAPASIIAQGRAFPGKTQPLCPYPQVATYRGEGDENSAESFSCQ